MQVHAMCSIGWKCSERPDSVWARIPTGTSSLPYRFMCERSISVCTLSSYETRRVHLCESDGSSLRVRSHLQWRPPSHVINLQGLWCAPMSFKWPLLFMVMILKCLFCMTVRATCIYIEWLLKCMYINFGSIFNFFNILLFFFTFDAFIVISLLSIRYLLLFFMCSFWNNCDAATWYIRGLFI